MNVLYLHQHFATRAGAGGTRSYEFAKYLVQHGHHVTMVAGNRQAGGIEDAPHQIVDGIEIISLGGFYSNHLSSRDRIREFLRYTWRCCVIRKLPRRPDVVIATSTPLTIGIPGWVLARRYDVPFVFEVRDLWPQAPIEIGALRNPIAIKLARLLERWLYRVADHIIPLSPGMERGVLEGGADPARVTTIPNASDTDLFGPAHRDRTTLDRFEVADRFVAVHGGSMGEANGLDYLIRAARVLRDRGQHDIQLLICGYGGTRERLEQMCAAWNLTNVTFTGSIPRQELGAIVSSVDVAITSFANRPVLATNSPNKLFDGLAAGVPNIVNSDGWTKELIERADAGCYVDVRRPEQLADALVRYRDDAELRERHGRNARVLAETTFDRQLLARRFTDVLETATRQQPDSGRDSGARAGRSADQTVTEPAERDGAPA